MRTKSSLLSLILVLVCSGGRALADTVHDAEPPTPHTGGHGSRIELEAAADFGVVQAPFFSPDFPELRAHGFVFSLTGRYNLSPSWQFGVRVPLALMSVRQPAGAFVDEGAWGNPSLFMRRWAELEAPWADAISIWAGAELGLPLAESGPAGSVLENRALEAANALEAYLWPEAFSPGTLPLVPSAGARFSSDRWSATAALATALLLRVTDASLSDGIQRHGLGFLPRLELSGGVRISELVRLSLAVDASWAAARVVDPASPASRVQWSLGPGLRLCFTHLELALTLRIPLGGALGGSTYAGGLALRSE
jgi:hypothetical protein